jgi:hypothetical protein
MEIEEMYSEFLKDHPNWVRGFKAIGDDFLHLTDEDKDSFCLIIKSIEYVKINSIGRSVTLEDFHKEPTKEEIRDIYQKQREIYPKLNEVVKQYLENNK